MCLRVRTDDEATLGADHVAGAVVLHQQGVGVIRALNLRKSIYTALQKKRCATFNHLFTFDMRTVQVT